MQPELENSETRPQHFDFIRNYFRTFSFDNHRLHSNTPYDLKQSPPDYKVIWDIILGYMVSATVKDFTIMVRVVDAKGD